MSKKKAAYGARSKELFELMDTVENWEQYLTEDTADIVKHLRITESVVETAEHFELKYPTVHANILRAIDRIKNKRTDFKRGGKTKQARELFELMDKVENWKEFVTDYEAFLAEQYRKVKNFYELGRILDLKPSNIATTLYGSTQKIGVIGKIKEGIPQTQRRDVDNRREDEQGQA